ERLTFLKPNTALRPSDLDRRERQTRHTLMASLELSELAHEGSSDIGIDLAVKKDWPVGFPKLRELVQVLQRADGRSLKTEALCDRRKHPHRQGQSTPGLMTDPQQNPTPRHRPNPSSALSLSADPLALPSQALPTSLESRRRRQQALWFCLVGPWRLRAH